MLARHERELPVGDVLYEPAGAGLRCAARVGRRDRGGFGALGRAAGGDAGGGAGADRRRAGSLGGGRHGGDEGSRAAPPGV
jgi:hypothetical protein